MDTPERNQIGTPISKFEDSPVFNYINSLSPIKPVKSIHFNQTFNSLNFASIPSVFTSPHVSSHKESRFLRRHNFSDQSKPEFSSDDRNKEGTNEEHADAIQLCDDPRRSIEEPIIESLDEHSELAVELPPLKHNCCSPKHNSNQYHGTDRERASETAATSASLVPYVQEASKEGSFDSEVNLQGISHIEPKREGPGCDWDSLMSDSTDLLIFNSPNESQAFKEIFPHSVDHGENYGSLGSCFTQDDAIDLQRLRLVGPVGSDEQYELQDYPSQPGEASTLQDIDHTHDNLPTTLDECMASMPSENIDNEPASNLHRGIRRRCLVFEAAGSHRKNLNSAENSFSSTSLQSDKNIAPKDKELVSNKPVGDTSRRILPGIGLHLNALARTSKDDQVAKHAALSCGGQPNMPNSLASFQSPMVAQESLHKLLTSGSSDKEKNPAANGVQEFEDGSQVSAYLATEEFNQRSPKKKRRKVENAVENESCKRCNCKKSKCLKLYCECFAAGVYCIEPCSCQDCFNKPIHEDTVLSTRKQIESRNPLAFAPKVIRSSETVPDIGDETINTPASARHKRGCNCKKSGCLKKYCECYQGGVGCSINCRCEGCKNAFGRKDGSVSIGSELEAEEEEETENIEKSVVDKSLQRTLIPNNEQNTNSLILNNEDQSSNPTIPATPLRFSRLSVQLPFSSKSKPPRSSFLTIGHSSGLQNSQRFGKPNFLRPQPKLDRSFQAAQADDMPEILRNNCSPSSGIKSGSPNSKRVSPPHSDFGSSPERRSSRKLILQSIPSFPSLTQS